jgi:GNAT superfamily N-acetyltransferase
MVFKIRPALPSEAEHLTELSLAGKRHWGYPEAWVETWREYLTVTLDYLATHTVACAEDETDAVVGFYALKHDGDRFELDTLILTPSFIGRGLGRQLFEHAAQTARALGAFEMLIEADPNAEGFYLRMGAIRYGANVSRLTGAERVLPLLRYALAGVKSDNITRNGI